jgi:hypothetical protein
MAVVRRDWIDSQAGYFRNKVRRLTARYQSFEQVKMGLLVGMLVLAILLVGLQTPLMEFNLFGDASLWSVILLLTGVFPVTFGVWEVYEQKMAIRELLWQYRNQADYFTLAGMKLDHVRSPQVAQAIIAQLGHTCLVESFLWAIHRYHREHEPLAGG